VFDFTPIADISDVPAGRAADVVGVICQVGDTEDLNLKSGGTKARKQISIVDDTACSIQITIWGE